MHRKELSRVCLAIISSILSFIGLALTAILLGFSRVVGYRFIWAFLFSLVYYGSYRYLKASHHRGSKGELCLAFMFVFLQAIGYWLQIQNHSGWKGLFICLVIGLALSPATAYGVRCCVAGLDRLKSSRPLHPACTSKRVFWSACLVILVFWLPVLLAYYPGLFNYDVGQQMSEILSGKFSNYQPLIHTIFLGGFYMLGGILGDYNIGIMLSVGIQMIVLASTFAGLLKYMADLKVSRWLMLLTLCGFALFPVHSVLAISCTKDTLFSAFMLQFAIRLHQVILQPARLRNKRWEAGTLALIIAIGLFRNNALFAVILCMPFCLLALPKPHRTKLFIVFIGGFVLYAAANFSLRSLTQADGVNTVDFVSIPGQQMARVYVLHKDEYLPSEEIEAYLPTAAYYYTYTADAVKTFAKVREPSKMWGFIKLWVKVGLDYPIEYIDAFLLNTQGYWWLDDTTHAKIYGEGLDERQGYLLTDSKQGYGINHKSLFKPLETVYEYLFSANEYQRIPVLSLIFAPSLYVWITLFVLLYAYEKAARHIMVVGGFLLCYVFTLLFGPCVLIRYVYPIVVCIPLMLFSPSGRGSKT